MRAVRTKGTEIVYRGPSPDIGDLYCHRNAPGCIVSVWEPDEEELKCLNEGGKILLWIHTEPIPPVGLSVENTPFTESVGKHPFKVIPELEDAERGNVSR